jgi:hypothetical protein
MRIVFVSFCVWHWCGLFVSSTFDLAIEERRADTVCFAGFEIM